MCQLREPYEEYLRDVLRLIVQRSRRQPSPLAQNVTLNGSVVIKFFMEAFCQIEISFGTVLHSFLQLFAVFHRLFTVFHSFCHGYDFGNFAKTCNFAKFGFSAKNGAERTDFPRISM